MKAIISKQSVVTGELAEDAWKLYRQSFDELRTLAVQRHVMYGDEFDAVMADSRVEKFLAGGCRRRRPQRWSGPPG